MTSHEQPEQQATSDGPLRSRIAVLTRLLESELDQPLWTPQSRAIPAMRDTEPLFQEIFAIMEGLVGARAHLPADPDRGEPSIQFQGAMEPLLDALRQLQHRAEQEIGLMCEWIEGRVNRPG